MKDGPTNDRTAGGVRHRVLTVGVVLGVSTLVSKSLSAQTVVLPAGATWTYLDDGSDQGTAWRAKRFNDRDWSSGAAELGYGDGDEATIVRYGADDQDKHITTYFRRLFFVSSPKTIGGLALRMKRDDGAVVYINQTEVLRTNMPDGDITYTTPAASAISGDAENAWEEAFIPASLLPSFSSVIAVEIHQHAGDDPDLSFDLELRTVPGIGRGPYLQRGSPTRVTVRWRSTTPSDSCVRYGTDPEDLTHQVSDAAATTEHEIEVTGLRPDTTYYYAVGTVAYAVVGGDADHFFVTAPATGTAKPTRVWVLGDSGTANTDAESVRDAYYAFTGARHTDLWLMLGDNAYVDGTDNEYQLAVYDMYPSMLRTSVLWPTFGNHDGRSASSATESGPYYDMFTLPTAAEAGGLASGTEAYYAFDYGNLHFICLDSTGSDRSVGSPMLTWLEADLAATDQDWVVAFWHHPPYSKGSHDSDALGAGTQMRSNVLPILEAGGTDLVLVGHSHNYERSYLIDGHYGFSWELTPEMILDGGDGRASGDGAYHKATAGPAPHEGTIYTVAGCSGKTGGGSLNHPVMHISLNVLGSLVLDFDGDRLDATFLQNTGQIRDTFTILKGPGPEFIRIIGAPEDDPASWIWPKAEEVGLSSFEIEMDQPATYVESTVTTTDETSSLAVTGLTYVGAGLHRIELSGPIPPGHWTTILLTVAGETGIESTFNLCVGHLPDDVNGDGQVSLGDATDFGVRFHERVAGPRRDRIDLDGNGQANLADATLFGQLWNGTSGHARWMSRSLPPKPQ